MKDIYLNLCVKLAMASRLIKQAIAAISLMIVSSHAFALKASDITEGWKEETSLIVPVVLFVIAGIGVCFAATAVISGIIAKKNNQPLSWQVGGVIGGALAIVIPVIILAVSGTLSGGQGDGGSMLDDLAVDY